MDDGGRKSEHDGREQNFGFGVDSSWARSAYFCVNEDESDRTEVAGMVLPQHLKRAWDLRAVLKASVRLLARMKRGGEG